MTWCKEGALSSVSIPLWWNKNNYFQMKFSKPNCFLLYYIFLFLLELRSSQQTEWIKNIVFFNSKECQITEKEPLNFCFLWWNEKQNVLAQSMNLCWKHFSAPSVTNPFAVAYLDFHLLFHVDFSPFESNQAWEFRK